jgi:putative nucleotidyltransferase with HDIG domain
LRTLPETTRAPRAPGARVAEAIADWLRRLVPLTPVRLVVVLSAAAAASLFLPGPGWNTDDSVWVPAFAVLTGLSVMLEFVAVELPHGGTLSVATITHIATVFLVPPPFAALSVGLAVIVEEIIHRRALVRLAFNASSYVLTMALASLAVRLIGDPRVLVTNRDHLPLVAMVVIVSLVYYVLNDLLTCAIMALTSGRSLAYLVRTNSRGTILAEAGAGMIGILFALVWIVEPFWTTLLVIPGAVIARSLQYIRQLELETRSAVASLAEVVDHRDASTFHHSERVAFYAVATARELNLEEDVVELIEQAAAVHDLGKIAVPDRILLKPGPLTAEERTAMAVHTEIGARILRQFHLFSAGASIVLHHHESYDGSGYPHGLAGDAIPIGARVVAVADAFDAMTSDRPYRSALSIEEAMARLRAGAGQQWDPIAVDALLGLLVSGRLDLDARPTVAEQPDAQFTQHVDPIGAAVGTGPTAADAA